jgi:hypothetical protein
VIRAHTSRGLSRPLIERQKLTPTSRSDSGFLTAFRYLVTAGLITGLVACGGDGGGENTATSNEAVNITSLVATPDTASTEMGTRVTVQVLANDTGFAEDTSSLSIVSKPANGKAVIRSDGTVAYTPASGFSGIDTFVYKILDVSGRSALATVSVRVACTTDCTSTAESITLTWDKVPGAVLGYLVYFGKGLVNDPASISTLIPKNSMTIDVKADLGLSPGDYACFWVQSVNHAGVSALSAPSLRSGLNIPTLRPGAASVRFVSLSSKSPISSAAIAPLMHTSDRVNTVASSAIPICRPSI